LIEIQSQPYENSDTLQIADGVLIGIRRLYYMCLRWSISLIATLYLIGIW